MNGKALILLVLAVLCGLGAMFGTNRMLSKQQSKPTLEMQDVLVAARDLKVEEVVRARHGQGDADGQGERAPGHFTSIKDVEDRWVQIKMLEGEPLLDRKLAPRGARRAWSRGSPRGCGPSPSRSTSTPGVSGFILPDHRVDVVQHETGPNGKSEAETILQDVLVLASGQVFTRPEDRSIQSRTVTLAVTPEQVDILVAAPAKGAAHARPPRAQRPRSTARSGSRSSPSPSPSPSRSSRWPSRSSRHPRHRHRRRRRRRHRPAGRRRNT